jgi:Domain of unknown function (DUF5664)
MSALDYANPKDAAGRAKLPLHLWPASATAYGAVGFLEGMLKYGRNNFRATDVAASVYVAAAKRHIDDWFEGNDNASDTGSPHLGNALACLAILVDAQVNGTLIDDRNFVPNGGAHQAMVEQLTAQVAHLTKLFAGRDPRNWDARDQLNAEQTSARALMAAGPWEDLGFGPLGSNVAPVTGAERNMAFGGVPRGHP